MAASLRYGRLSIIPAVPCVRPSQGSETMPANGTHTEAAKLLGRVLDEQADFPVSGVIARARWAGHRGPAGHLAY